MDNNNNKNDSMYHDVLKKHFDNDSNSDNNVQFERVEVNQRALIDKILARYATASAIYRELIQNSNDANATTAKIHFQTTASTNTISGAGGNNKHKLLVSQVTYKNNGMEFREQDWSRLQKIAEGNPDETKIGAFGVGAYSMFSICEQPMVLSGSTCLMFVWKGDALYTKKTVVVNNNTKGKQDDVDESRWTSFLLPSRDLYPLPNFQEFGEFLISALTFTQSLKEIMVYVDGKQILHIKKTILQPPRPVQIVASPKSGKAMMMSSSFFWNSVTGGGGNSNNNNNKFVSKSPNGLFALPKSSRDNGSLGGMHESLVRMTVSVGCDANTNTNTACMDARYVSAIAETNIPFSLAKRMERVTKKVPPKHVNVQIFLNHNELSTARLLLMSETTATDSSGSGSKNDNDENHQQKMMALSIAQSFAPTIGQGRIFIGFRTSQTTGLAVHLSAPFVPTVEREAMDLQDTTLATFNGELLEFSGILLRLTLEHTMRNVVDVVWQQNKGPREILEKKLMLELEENKKKKKKRSDAEHQQNVETTAAVNENDDGSDPDNNAEEASSASGGIMNFARFMARGVKKKIVSVAKTVETLIEGDGAAEQLLLYPPDPRPLEMAEKQAIVLMSSFCPQQSTPDPAVGTALAQGFSNCMRDVAPPVLTRSGVVPGNEARLPNSGIEGFVNDNVIRTVVFENAKEYHTVIARCRKLNFDDLLNVISKSVLEQQKAVHLLKWWTHFSAMDVPSKSLIRGNRLKEVIRYYPRDDDVNNNNSSISSKKASSPTTPSARRVQNLGEFLFFVEKSSPFADRDVPLPETVLAKSFQDELGWSALNRDALYDKWFSPVPIEIFAEFISHHPCMTKAAPEDDMLRIRVLSLLSREFMRCHGSERSVFGSFVHSLLANKRCIPFDSDMPTQHAADYPEDLYLYSAELKAFDGVGSFHKASSALQSAGVTEEFLLMLGVRKSVSIDFLFAHLDTLSWSKNPQSLIEYLRSATLTSADLNKLSTTKYLPAADDNSRMYSPSELYLPNEQLKIFPFIKTLRWPSEPEVSEKSENGKFLLKLGMRPLPSLIVVLAYVCGENLEEEKRLKGIDFICDRLVPHGVYYAQYSSMGFTEKKKYRFLPCIVNNVITGDEPKVLLQSPTSCFSDEACGIMGFPVIDPKLGKKGELFGSLFQCSQEPQVNFLLQQLLHLVNLAKNRMKGLSRSKDEQNQAENIEAAFAMIFNYLSHRSSELKYSSMDALKRENFIPCMADGKLKWYRPDEVFFKRTNRDGESLTEELFHVIEFSPFLAATGVKEEATTKEIFQKLLESPEVVMETLGSEKKYRSLLRRIAADPPFALSRPSKEIKNTPFLLGYSAKPSTEQKNEDDKLTYQLSKAEDIYIIDNANFGRMFPVKRAPPETDLEDFYTLLGSQYISKSVNRQFEIVGRPVSNTELTEALRERLNERGPLLVSPNVTSRPLLRGAASKLSELEFYQAKNLLAVYSLGKISRRNRTTCFSRPSGGKKNAIYITSDFDIFDVGQAIGDLILKRCQLEDAFFISSLLEAPLGQLRARGFPVDRLIKPEPAVIPEPPPPSPPNLQESAAPAARIAAADGQTSQPDGLTGSKADILKQTFPDANLDFIQAALGPNPSVDDVRTLADKMASGHYPKESNKGGDTAVDTAADTDADSSTLGELDYSPENSVVDHEQPTTKKKSLRKRLKQAFGGKKGSNFSTSGGFPDVGGPPGGGSGVGGGVVAPHGSSHQETRGPVSPATDAHTQDSLESMLENSVQSAAMVQKNGIDSPDTNLTSIPQELDRGETCEVIPGHSLKPFAGPRGNAMTQNGIRVFASKTNDSSEAFLSENEASLELFASVLERLTIDVFGLNIAAVAIYHEPAGVMIAFNSNRALHFNFRFFHALHYLQNKHNSPDCYAYWYITICHELAHNFVSGHTKEHGFYTESFACHYTPKLVAMLRNLE